jgi:hypothetical protein
MAHRELANNATTRTQMTREIGCEHAGKLSVSLLLLRQRVGFKTFVTAGARSRNLYVVSCKAPYSNRISGGQDATSDDCCSVVR